MSKQSRTPWIVFGILLILAIGIGYYIYQERRAPHHHRVPTEVAEKPAAPEEPTTRSAVPGPEAPRTLEETDAPSPDPQSVPDEAPAATPPQSDPCEAMFSRMQDYFEYLEQREYFQRISPGKTALQRFEDILRRLAKNPPVPAGEGNNPRLVLANLYHFFRTMKGADLRLAREIMANESESLEDTFDMLYTWLLMDPPCADPHQIRPSFEITYAYAAFFLNTVGGRAYLFRRPAGIRLVVQYYAIMIVHEANQRKQNLYGIDLLPLLGPLRNEISHFQELLFQQQYLSNLDRLEYEYRRLR